jgi:hypothetical protein
MMLVVPNTLIVVAITPAPHRSPERQEGQWNAAAENGIHAMDSYSLGVLDGTLCDDFPAQFTKVVQRLLTANVKMCDRECNLLLKCPASTPASAGEEPLQPVFRKTHIP